MSDVTEKARNRASVIVLFFVIFSSFLNPWGFVYIICGIGVSTQVPRGQSAFGTLCVIWSPLLVVYLIALLACDDEWRREISKSCVKKLKAFWNAEG